MNQQCFNDWTVQVCEELARFGLTAEKLVPWGFPWSLWWGRGVAPVTAAGARRVHPASPGRASKTSSKTLRRDLSDFLKPPAGLAMKTRYAITHIGRDGLRVLTFANQGRNHYDDQADAVRRLAGFVQNNPVETLRDIYGDQAIGTADDPAGPPKGWTVRAVTRATDEDFVQNSCAAGDLPVRSGSTSPARIPTTAGRNPVDTMTDDQNQELYEAMRSDLETGECALLDDSRSGPTVVRFCRDTLGVIDGEAYQEKRRPFRTAPHGIFADTRQALRAVRMEMDRRQFWPAIYHVNDHGNVTLLSGSGREIAAWV